jgi:hypothetical protein
MDTVENLKRLYGGRKTVEVTVGAGQGPGFFGSLGGILGDDASLKTTGDSAAILIQDPKEALRQIIDLSQSTHVQIEWLNVRKNTLEDVFIDSVAKGEGEG